MSSSPEAAGAARPWYASGAAIVALFALLLLPNVLQGFQSTDTDMFYHLACGRWMVEHGEYLDREVFSFTREGTPWVNYSWGSQLVPWAAAELGGIQGLIALRVVLLLATVGALWRAAFEKSGGDRLVACAVSLAVFAALFSRGMNVRPHAWSYLGLVLLLLLLERMWRAPRRFDWRIPLLCVAWANLHGIEQPVVFAVIAIHALAALVARPRAEIASAWRDWDWLRWPALLAACVAAFLATPYGLALWGTGAQPFDEEAMSRIQEMQPYSWHYFFALAPPLELGLTPTVNYLVLFSLVLVPWWLVRGELRSVLLLALGLGLVLLRARFLIECAILVSAGAALELGRLRARPGVARRIASASAAGLLLLVAIASAGNVQRGVREGFYRSVLPETLPSGAARFLAEHGFEGNLVLPATVAGYAEWELFPQVRVFADMRIPQPFEAQILWIDTWLHASSGGPEARALLASVLARWPVDLVLFRRDLPLARDLWSQEGRPYALVFADQRWVLFARRDRLSGARAGLELRHVDPFGNPAEWIARVAAADRAGLRAEIGRLVADSPEDPLARRVELQLLFAEGRAAEAGRRAGELVRRFPREPSYLLAAAGAAQAQGDPAAAFERLREALAIEPGDLAAAAAAGRLALALGKAEEGRLLLEATAEERAHNLPAAELQLLGELREASGARLGAVDAFERALLLSDDPVRRQAIAARLAASYLELEREVARTGDEHRVHDLYRRIAENSHAPEELRARARARLAQ